MDIHRYRNEITERVRSDPDRSYYICPITNHIMIDPVLASDSYTYERSAINNIIQTTCVSPKTGRCLTDVLCDNIVMKQQIDAYHLGSVYFIQPPGYIDTDTYKLGRSKYKGFERIDQYTKKGKKKADPIVHAQCTHPWKVEAALKKEFHQHFTCVAGTEYFAGDIAQMRAIFLSVLATETKQMFELDQQIKCLLQQDCPDEEEVDEDHLPYNLHSIDRAKLEQLTVTKLREECNDRAIDIVEGAHMRTCIRKLLEWKDGQFQHDFEAVVPRSGNESSESESSESDSEPVSHKRSRESASTQSEPKRTRNSKRHDYGKNGENLQKSHEQLQGSSSRDLKPEEMTEEQSDMFHEFLDGMYHSEGRVKCAEVWKSYNDFTAHVTVRTSAKIKQVTFQAEVRGELGCECQPPDEECPHRKKVQGTWYYYGLSR